jgi:biopolymer transport protein TolR
LSAKKKGLNLKLSDGQGAVSDINVTPLIDVVLVLLIIFMVITPIMLHQMAINLPEKTEAVPEENVPQDQLVVAACKDGTVSLNRTIFKTLPELHDEVARRIRSKSEKVVFVDSDPDAAYEAVVALMDSVRDAGVTRIGIASLKEGEDFIACTPVAAAPPPAPAAPAAP